MWDSAVVAHRLSSCGSWALECVGLVVQPYRLHCSKACGIFSNQGLNLCPLHWQVDSLLSEPPGKALIQGNPSFFFLRPSTDWMRPTTLWIVICFIQSWLCKHQSRLHNIITESRLIFGSVLKNLPANARDMGSIPGLERFPGEGNGNPLQYPCLGSPWPEEPDGLQPMRWQSQTQLSS